ncbi:MAG: E3 ubiquitin-protein ligase pellino family protein [Treponema sp.]|nr:E3 ubiquitin-protein ligase pellino family protein [Treponema sp.]MCL2251959.1 E3 ubiquitin-protein ligase pellino family protein [Treponema sp.]
MVTLKPETDSHTECANPVCSYGDCPLHSENPPFNAKVLAAIAEGDAIFKGEKPAKWYTSFEEAREDLEK